MIYSFFFGGWLIVPLIIGVVLIGRRAMKWNELAMTHKAITLAAAAALLAFFVWALWPVSWADDMGGMCTQPRLLPSSSHCTNESGGM